MTPAPPAFHPRSARYATPSDRRRVLAVERLFPRPFDGGQRRSALASFLGGVSRRADSVRGLVASRA